MAEHTTGKQTSTDVLTLLFEEREVIEPWIGVTAISFFLIFFYFANKCVLYLTRHRKDWSSYWRWRNLLISWLHALICGSWDLLIFIVSWSALTNDLIKFQSLASYLLVAFSTAYFTIDLWDMWIERKAGELWELVLHHIAISSMFVFNMMSNQCIGYNVVALLAEVNSFFLHSRKLLQMAGLSFKNSRLYTLNAVANIATFIVCRFGSMIKIVYAIVYEANRVSTVYLTCISSCMFVLWAINPVLLYRLVRADMKMWRGHLNRSPSFGYVVAAPYKPSDIADKSKQTISNGHGNGLNNSRNADSINSSPVNNVNAINHKNIDNDETNGLITRRHVEESRN